jgi:acetyl esterase/lipase
MKRTIRPLLFLFPILSLAPCACLRADSSAPAGTIETLPASSPYGKATAVRNIAYVPNGTPAQTFDLYSPAQKPAGLLPFVVWVHGGAWEMGSKEWDNVKYLVKNGYAIATINYRLAPQFKFPIQIQDCNAALNFIMTHAESYGLDPKRMIIGGASAGGHLSLLLGMARHEQEFGADPAIKPLAILDFFGPNDLNAMSSDLQNAATAPGIRLNNRILPELLGASAEQDPAKARAASPITYVNADVAPVLIFHGTKDALVPYAQSERLHAKLDEAKVKNQIFLIDGAPHDGPAFSTPEQQTRVLDFLRGIMP